MAKFGNVLSIALSYSVPRHKFVSLLESVIGSVSPQVLFKQYSCRISTFQVKKLFFFCNFLALIS